MRPPILQEVPIDTIGAQIATGVAPVVFVAAPNFEDRSVTSTSWVIDKLAGRDEGIAAHVLWLQTPGADDVFDRIKADNRDSVANKFKHLGANFAMTRVDIPSTETNLVRDKNRNLANMVGGKATLILDISSLPRTIVRHLLDGLVQESLGEQGLSPYGRIVCLYTAAGDYPAGADSDVIGGITGYFTKRTMHDLVSTAGILDAVVSLAGTSHDSAQTLDALWEHGLSARTTLSAISLLNRDNFVYSYQRLAKATWVLNRARENGTELIYAFELGDAIRHMFLQTDLALARHLDYRATGGVGMPTFLIGGFGPKPIGLAALLATMRYRQGMETRNFAATADVLQVRGWQYTTRYSHGSGAIKAFEVNLNELYAPHGPDN